ncbi:hypothetical protein PMI07_002359 [Rhizobium sp. CF080]|uniref:hypothetical protein n=1 Tax=Rhizobium sp. (strain CF080) TaxID=1144310 RepID=UPI0002717811|nr:hypothetical protein [Rhizobium sp. CF080]EUB95871.1 hypothetical protein PMI07_002359 [Rhizobium sp. CF080]
MTQRYFVDEAGRYLGSYDGPEEETPDAFSGAVQVPAGPEQAGQVWDFGALEFLPYFPIPESVTARQFKLQLVATDLIDAVNAWIATQDRATQVAYEYSGTFVRNEPMMQAGFEAMGFQAAQIDAFFIAASQL